MPSSPVTELREGILPRPASAGPARPNRASGAPRSTRLPRAALGPRAANLTSGIGAGLCVAAGASLALGAPLAIAAVLFPLGALCDLADGHLARAARDPVSRQVGVFVDSLADKVGEVGIWIGLAIALRGDPVLLSLLMAGFGIGFLSSWVKAFAEVSRFRIDWEDTKLFGRAGRAALLSATLLLAVLLTVQQNEVFFAGLFALAAFNAATLVARLVRVAGSLAKD